MSGSAAPSLPADAARPPGPCLLSVVSPVYNEAGGICEFHRRVTQAMAGLPADLDYELVLVDDGSSDGSFAAMKQLARSDPHVVVHRLSRNFGHQLAITAGTDLARGDVVVVLDSDLQDPPEVVPDMVRLWQQGWDVVYGRRRSRAGESRFKLLTARAFYRLVNAMSEVDLPLDAGDFRLLDRRVAEVLTGMREQNRYVRGLVSWAGFRQCAYDYDRDSRHLGVTSYTPRKMLRLATDGIASFSEVPLTLATRLGFLVSLASVLLLVVLVGAKILHPSYALPGYASLMAVVLFLGGVQLITVGILGQYVGRIYRETKGRPLYVIAETVEGASGRPTAVADRNA